MADVIRMHGIKVDKDGKFVFPAKQSLPTQTAVHFALQARARRFAEKPQFGQGKIENVKPNA